MFQNRFSKFTFLCLIFFLSFSGFAQTKRKPVGKKPAKRTAAVKTEPIVEQTETPTVEAKKNSRPESDVTGQISVEQTTEATKNNARPTAKNEVKPVYFYEFSQPNFYVSKILIEHDENGKGKISILKKDFTALETDPLQLSATTLEKVKTIWQTLDFLDSTEDYQYEKDYAHLGEMKFTMRRDGKERTAEFNYTNNKDAKALADEYRRIAQQFTWIFDINVARENQPLDAPRQLDALDSLIRRNEISDAAQMIPLLTELSNDERIPLIARNHATKLIKQIEKSAKK